MKRWHMVICSETVTPEQSRSLGLKFYWQEWHALLGDLTQPSERSDDPPCLELERSQAGPRILPAHNLLTCKVQSFGRIPRVRSCGRRARSHGRLILRRIDNGSCVTWPAGTWILGSNAALMAVNM